MSQTKDKWARPRGLCKIRKLQTESKNVGGRKITVENNKTNSKSTIERDDTKSEKSQKKEERNGKTDE